MKTRILFVLMLLMSMTLVAPAQVKSSPTKQTKSSKKLPLRDPKTGRFIKKSDKKLPARDPKTGRFIKKSDKKMPPRDPKTGRFIKKPPIKKG